MASRRGDRGDSGQSRRPDALTRILQRIHCGGRAEGDALERGGDLDALMIEHFLDTLADIATAVAERACKGES